MNSRHQPLPLQDRMKPSHSAHARIDLNVRSHDLGMRRGRHAARRRRCRRSSTGVVYGRRFPDRTTSTPRRSSHRAPSDEPPQPDVRPHRSGRPQLVATTSDQSISATALRGNTRKR